MGIKREKISSSSSSTSPCAHLRAAYHNCFNRWYSEKFVKGQWDKEECLSEWQKYRDCLSQHLEDKHLSPFLEAEIIVNQADSRSPTGVSDWRFSEFTAKSKQVDMTRVEYDCFEHFMQFNSNYEQNGSRRGPNLLHGDELLGDTGC